MGLFLPLVVYVANRKKYENWPTNPYIAAKTKFLNVARVNLTPIYERIRDNVPDTVTFGVKEYSDGLCIIETDQTNKPCLVADSVRNNCTLLIADPRDLLRTRREIENDHQTTDETIINKAIEDEIGAVENFLQGYTPFIFVPGFSFAPYRNPFPDKSADIVSKHRNFCESHMCIMRNGKVKYMSYLEEGLSEVAGDLMSLQEVARIHVMDKLEGLKEAAERRIF